MSDRPDIDAIKARAEAATPGEWQATTHWEVSAISQHIALCAEMNGRWNAEFIAHARTDIPALLAYIAALNEVIERLEAAKEMRA